MKTANKWMVAGSWLAIFGCFVIPLSGHAEGAVPSAAAVMPTIVSTPASSSSTVTPSPKIAAPAVNSNQAVNGVSEISSGPPVDKKDVKDFDSLDIKVPDSVKTIMKHLGTATQDVTLDDLNAAREAIAKLDVLIDIEKRLADLDKIRREREGKSMMQSIPASALAMPSPATSFQPANIQSMPSQGSITDVIQITGSNGNYAALVKEGVDKHYIHTGDRLSDGSIVLAITPGGVELTKGKTKHLVEVKDVQTVFGNSP